MIEPRFYKHDQRGYFQKKRWPLMDLMSQKISNMHEAFQLSRGYMAMAGWSGSSGHGTMHVFSRTGRRLIQVRKIENGYIREIHRGKHAEEFDNGWYREKLDEWQSG